MRNVGAPTTHFLLEEISRWARWSDDLSWEQRANFLNHQIDADFIVPAFWNDYVGVALGRFYEFHVHRANCRHVLVNHGFDGAAPFANVSPQAADEAQVRFGIDENFDVT